MVARAAGKVLRHVVAEWRPDVGRAAGIGERKRLEVGWQYANDLERNLVEHNRFADDVFVGAELANPVGMTQNDDVPTGGMVFVGREIAAEAGRDAERVEEILRDAQAEDHARRAVSGGGWR